MISPLGPRTADSASRRARSHESNEAALRLVPHLSPASRGKKRTVLVPRLARGWLAAGAPAIFSYYMKTFDYNL